MCRVKKNLLQLLIPRWSCARETVVGGVQVSQQTFRGDVDVGRYPNVKVDVTALC